MLGTFGTIDLPSQYTGYGDLNDLTKFGNVLLSLITTLAGIFVLINLIAAGYGYLSANGNSKMIGDAGNKILQSLIGLIIIAAAYIIAAVIGFVFFKDASFFIKPIFSEISP